MSSDYVTDTGHLYLDELALLIEDQEEHGQSAPTRHRTRGLKIDFTGKDDGPDEESDEENEPEAPVEGKGKGRAVPPASKKGPSSKPPSTVKPASTASSKNA